MRKADFYDQSCEKYLGNYHRRIKRGPCVNWIFWFQTFRSSDIDIFLGKFYCMKCLVEWFDWMIWMNVWLAHLNRFLWQWPFQTKSECLMRMNVFVTEQQNPEKIIWLELWHSSSSISLSHLSTFSFSSSLIMSFSLRSSTTLCTRLGRSLTAMSRRKVPDSMQSLKLIREWNVSEDTWGLPHSPLSASRSSSYLIHLESVINVNIDWISTNISSG